MLTTTSGLEKEASGLHEQQTTISSKSDIAVTLKNCSLSFGDVNVLNNVSIDIYKMNLYPFSAQAAAGSQRCSG